MKAILEFNLPEDKDLYDYARKGADAHFVLDAFYTELRTVYKYDNPEKTAEEWKDLLLEIMKDYNVQLHGDY